MQNLILPARAASSTSTGKPPPVQIGQLVHVKPEGKHLEPYTTHEIIADCAGVQRSTVARLVNRHQKDLEEFGVIGFDIRKPQPGSLGGRPEKIWHLNEQQATLFITYLQNTAAVRQFKKNLVRAFFAMRAELAKRKELRTEGKPIRRSMTDAIIDSGENERMHGKAIPTYTNLAYKAVTGKNANQLRRERGADKRAVAADFLTSDELAAYQKKEAAIAALLDVGMQYDQIKAILAMQPGGLRQEPALLVI